MMPILRRKGIRAVLLMAVLVLAVLLRVETGNASGLTVTIGTTNGRRGATVSFPVTFNSPPGTHIVALETDIGFNSTYTPIVPNEDKPRCAASPAILAYHKGVSFAFLPNGCSGIECNTVRVLILDDSAHTAIPDGTLLYTCTVKIESDAPAGIYTLTALNLGGAVPSGGLQIVTSINGQVTVTN